MHVCTCTYTCVCLSLFTCMYTMYMYVCIDPFQFTRLSSISHFTVYLVDTCLYTIGKQEAGSFITHILHEHWCWCDITPVSHFYGMHNITSGHYMYMYIRKHRRHMWVVFLLCVCVCMCVCVCVCVCARTCTRMRVSSCMNLTNTHTKQWSHDIITDDPLS